MTSTPVHDLVSLIEQEADAKARAVVAAAFGVVPAGPGSATVDRRTRGGRALRKKPPRQLCPVPYCRDPAAPVFGMVCGKHRDVPKAKIKEYREARRAKKA